MEFAPSKIFTLQIKATLDEVSELKPKGGVDAEEFSYYFKTRCNNNNCGKICTQNICLKLSMNYVKTIHKCEFCHGKGNIIMLSGYGRPYTEEDSDAKRFVPPMRFKCMGLEPLDFVFGKGWIGNTFMGVRELDFEEGMASIQLNGKRAAVYDVEARFEANEI